MSQAMYYQWKSKFGGMEVEEARRLHALEDECGRVKRIVADQAIRYRWKEKRRPDPSAYPDGALMH